MYRIFFILLLLSTQSLNAQKYRNADRCADIDRGAPIQNIFVDSDNNKWVSDFKGLYLAQSPDYAKFLTIPDDQWSLLNMKDGNAELKIPRADLSRLMGDAFDDINTAAYDATSQTLYIGTTEYGVYQFKTKPSLELIGELDTRSSKLKSNFINTIFIEQNGKTWIGTEDGVLVGKPGNWKLIERGYDILAITRNDASVYLLGDGETIIELDAKEKGYLVEIEERYIDGEIKDIAVDSKGKLWIASEIISGYDFATESYEEFGPAENFTSQFVSCITIDKDDALWVGTEDKGVYFIGASSSFSVSLIKSKDLSCTPNAKDAALEVRANGGQPPYTYKWTDTSIKGDQPKNVGAGNYTVTVTDSKGTSKTAQIIIEDPQMIVQINQDRTASFGGNADGSASLKVSGGTPGYTYKWDNGETTAKAEKLTKGSHAVTVTDKTGCSTTLNIDISEGLAALAANIQQTDNINCAGEQTAGLLAKVSGGKEPYTYSWDKSAAKAAQVNNLAAGQYILTVKDATGESTTANVTIEEPNPLKANIVVEASATANNNDGKAKVQITGGNTNYSYAWDTGEKTEVATKLGAGTHVVTITDGNGCTTTASVDITEDILPLAATIKQTAEINCSGEQTAAMEVTISGGKSPFNYQWNDSNLKGDKIQGITAGTYTVTITDASGKSSNANIDIKEPTSLSLNVSAKSSANLGKQDGKAVAKVNGGTGKYTYKWSNGETNDKAEKLAAGTHDVTVSDENGCSTVASVEIGEDIQALSVDIETTQEIACAGEASASLSVDISGGKPPFSYQWTNGLNGEKPTGLSAGEYALTVTDAAGNTSDASIKIESPKALNASISPKKPATTNNKDGVATAKGTGGTGDYSYKWDNGETTASAEKLGAGSHTVTVTDEKGCTANANIEITEDILPLTVSISQTTENKCFEDKSAAISLDVSGGKSPFTYVWNNNSITGDKASNLPAGDYIVTVTDAAGTSQNATISIPELAKLSAEITVNSPASTGNADGKATVKAQGGTGEFTYKWDNGETTATATKLSPGTRNLTITDSNGCTTIASTTISEDILELNVSIEQTVENKCFGEELATIEVAVNGGKGPYEYTWNQSDITGNAASNLKEGTYTVKVKDAVGTEKSANITIETPTELSIELLKNKPATNEDSKDGKAEIKVSGGTAPYVYNWDNNETEAVNAKMSFGTHQVTVTDAKGCTANLSVETGKKIMPALTAGRLRAGQTLKLEKLYFPADSTEMTKESLPTVDEIYSFLEDNPKIVIEIGGHTNGIPSHEFCDKLSTARAKNVADYIIAKGVDPTRVVYKGYGKRNPLMTNKTETGRKRNQRVEVKILNLGE